MGSDAPGGRVGLSQRLRATAPHLAAALFVAHVVTSCFAVIPRPAMALDHGAWKDARASRELQLWSEQLGVPKDQLDEGLFALAGPFVHALSVAGLPLKPYQWVTANTQNWPMFAAGTPLAHTYQVRARKTGGAWQTLYAKGDPDARFLAYALESPRVRSAIYEASWRNYKKARKRICKAVARQAFQQLDVDTVECAFRVQHIKAPIDDGRAYPAPRDARERPVRIRRADLAAPAAQVQR